MSGDDNARDAPSLDDALHDAVAEGRLLLAHCGACDHWFWYPRGHCPVCGSASVELLEPSGPPRVYAATTNYRPRGGNGTPPAQVGYVEYPEGVRVLVTLDFADGDPTIGTEVAPARVGEGETARLVFRPVA